MSEILYIILLNDSNNIIEETNIQKPGTYQDLLLALKKLAKLPQNFQLFIKTQEDSEIIIDNPEKYPFVKNLLFIRENDNIILNKSIFSINYNNLSENDKALLDDQYNCLLCMQQIKNQNPYFCYFCQKVYHIQCLENWDKQRKNNHKNLNCPFCRKELPLDKWQKKLDFQEKRKKDAEILNKLNKFDKKTDENNLKEYTDYIKKSSTLINNVLLQIIEINSLNQKKKY